MDVRRAPPVGICNIIVMGVTIRANVVRIVVANVVNTVRRAKCGFSLGVDAKMLSRRNIQLHV